MNKLGKFMSEVAARVPVLRARLADAGLRPEEIASFADLARLPVMRKTDLTTIQQQSPPFGGLLGVPLGELERIYVSPGPIYDPQGKGEDYWRWREALVAAGFGPGDIVVNTFSYHLTPAAMMFDSALRSLGAVVLPAGVGNAELLVRAMRDIGVTGFVGVPSFLYTLVKKAEELGYDGAVDLKLRKAFITAEKLPEELRQTLDERYGVKVYQGYGTAEAGCVAFECPCRTGMHLARDVHVEICAPDTGTPLPYGTPGEVVVTVLNPVYPLVRFGTGDLGVMTGAPCPCGHTGPRLVGIYGRTAEGVKVRGLFIYPGQVRELAARLAGVGRSQAVVTRDENFKDVLTLRIEPASGCQVPDAAAIARQAKEYLRLTVGVEMVPPGTIKEGEPTILDRRKWD
ncbi:MAG: AMP-binding protein [Bacillota bacterium]